MRASLISYTTDGSLEQTWTPFSHVLLQFPNTYDKYEVEHGEKPKQNVGD